MTKRGQAARRLPMVVVAMFVMLCARTGTAAAQVDYLSIAPDLPLMPGLSEQLDGASNFDSPAGRIAEARATGRVAASEVEDFYAECLPALGWQRCPDAARCWQREEEELRIATEGAGAAGLRVVFRLKPEPN